jgi:hypothetical protein
MTMSTNYIPPRFSEYLETAPPETLYHYTSQTGLLNIIETAELWATKVQYMNDATEFYRALNMARSILDDMIGQTLIETPVTAHAQLKRSLAGLEGINIFAACFCEDGDLLSQWRGYSESGGGASIGFGSAKLTK